jgi:hypothetical protein
VLVLLQILALLSGIINFKGDIGYSDICVKIDGNEEIYNLAYGFLSRTYLGTEVNQRKSNSYTEFYSILNYVYENLMKAINIGARRNRFQFLQWGLVSLLKKGNKVEYC